MSSFWQASPATLPVHPSELGGGISARAGAEKASVAKRPSVRINLRMPMSKSEIEEDDKRDEPTMIS
jgi:hypothetical protein